MRPQIAKFCLEYLKDGNGKQAAIRAGYSEKTAGSQAHDLLKRPDVKEKVGAKVQKTMDNLEISVDRILKERARLAFYDPGDIALANIKKPGDIAKLPEDVRRAISGWKWDKEGRLVLLMAGKDASLTALERHKGMYVAEEKADGVLSIQINLG